MDVPELASLWCMLENIAARTDSILSQELALQDEINIELMDKSLMWKMW